MKLLPIITIFAATGWIGWSIERGLRQRSYARAWNAAATLLGITGLALGIWFVTRERFISPEVRVFGFPFHLGASEFIDGRWLGGASKFALFAFLGDIALGIGICLLPLRIAQFIFE